jgi:hypothetical protein
MGKFASMKAESLLLPNLRLNLLVIYLDRPSSSNYSVGVVSARCGGEIRHR